MSLILVHPVRRAWAPRLVALTAFACLVLGAGFEPQQDTSVQAMVANRSMTAMVIALTAWFLCRVADPRTAYLDALIAHARRALVLAKKSGGDGVHVIR